MPSRPSPDLISSHAHRVLIVHAPAPICAALLAHPREIDGGNLHALAWLEALGAAPDLLYAQCGSGDATPFGRRLQPPAPAPRLTLHRYRRIRSGVSDPQRPPGCVVVTRLPTRDAAQAQHHADAAFAALQDGAHALRGLIASHLHLSEDGRGLLEYAEWSSADAQRRALRREPERLPLAALPAARVTRYRPRALVRPGDLAQPVP
ncbi:antibiotic biosynthesis monooxygenase [Xanthomonas sp. AM6]|uniref:antibiotic biosynthesis monooxygenase n=1 Tax=Xanthomonas sp. AM6 TaxID=2982531 RepID=UPI0021DB07E1|nr:antibiotic biosynthesis monooxygenase [Xanthomonas sp. AM6]UYB51494.1 antibiotic biosynthesis monooxygenase [Xanthomonas sp. AM6]